MVTMPRPMNPFLASGYNVFSPVQMAQQGYPLQSPAIRAPQVSTMPATRPQMPVQQPQVQPAPQNQQGGLAALGGNLNSFLGSDPALAWAAGVLGGGSTGEALGRGFANALAAKQAAQQPGESTSSLKEYAFAKSQGYDGSFMDFNTAMKKAGATTVTLDQGGDVFAGMPKDVRDEMFKRQADAQDAADLITITNQGRQLLDRGAITGAGSDIKIGALKWANTLGIDVPQDAANNSEAFKAVMGQAVGKIIKQFGSGTGLSDADRQYAERIVGGSVDLNEAAIRRIFDIADKAARSRIDNYTVMRDKVLNGDMTAILGVNQPPAYQAPAPGPVYNWTPDGGLTR